MWVQSLGQEDPLEEGKGPHSSIFACKIPWTEEPGGLQCVRSQKIQTWLKWHSRHRYIGSYIYVFPMYESVELVAQSCLTLCDSMDCIRPGSSVHGILQARILEWVAIPFSRGSSPHRDRTWFSHIAGRFFTIWTTREVYYTFPYICTHVCVWPYT